MSAYDNNDYHMRIPATWSTVADVDGVSAPVAVPIAGRVFAAVIGRVAAWGAGATEISVDINGVATTASGTIPDAFLTDNTSIILHLGGDEAYVEAGDGVNLHSDGGVATGAALVTLIIRR